MELIITASFFIALILLAFNFVLSLISFNKTGSAKYSFLSYFPFELNRFKRGQNRSWVLETLMILAMLCLCFSVSFFIILNYTKSMAYALGILFIVDIIVFHILYFVKLSNFKFHIIMAITFYLLTFLIYLIEIFIFTNSRSAGFIVTNVTLIWIFTIIGLIFLLFLALNPSYKNWVKMKKVDAETFYRPKVNYLASLERGTFLAYLIAYIPLLTAIFG